MPCIPHSQLHLGLAWAQEALGSHEGLEKLSLPLKDPPESSGPDWLPVETCCPLVAGAISIQCPIGASHHGL